MKRVILCALLMAWSTLASAVVYKWVDAQGKTQYGDRPPDGVHAEVVEGWGVPAPRTSPPPAARAPTAPRLADCERRQESGAERRFRGHARQAMHRRARSLQEAHRRPPPLQDRRQRRTRVFEFRRKSMKSGSTRSRTSTRSATAPPDASCRSFPKTPVPSEPAHSRPAGRAGAACRRADRVRAACRGSALRRFCRPGAKP